LRYDVMFHICKVYLGWLGSQHILLLWYSISLVMYLWHRMILIDVY
jgi:hypothetical protein